MNVSDPQLLEALLFAAGESRPMSMLADQLGWELVRVQSAAAELSRVLHDRGIRLIATGPFEDASSELALATHPAAGDILAGLRKEELSQPLSRATLETFATIVYSEAGITKPEIDYIRGVNSGHALRTLLVRGLIDKAPSPHDKRLSVYRTSAAALAELGIASAAEMPEAALVRAELSEITGRMEGEIATEELS